MLPISPDNGSRLAAILPTCLSCMGSSFGVSPEQVLAKTLDADLETIGDVLGGAAAELPQTQSVVVIVVDGLGSSNLKARAAHARTLRSLASRRIETVMPSTTGAALTSLTTGRLPGTHGLLGYRIRHPRLGLRTTLKEWAEVQPEDRWQAASPVFTVASAYGARTVTVGRPAHASGGLTESILAGAEYLPGQTIEDRFAVVSQLLSQETPVFAYLYVDELDKAAHAYGSESPEWVRRLEQLDAAVEAFLRTIPANVGVVVTADHGIVDVPREKRLILDTHSEPFSSLSAIGGEPRLRYLYLNDGKLDSAATTHRAEELAEKVTEYLGKRAWVGTREEAIAAGWFGSVAPAHLQRIGDVVVAARGQYAFYLDTDTEASRNMVGQHGSFSDEERGVPLLLAGAFAGSNFASALTRTAKLLN